MAQSWHRLAFEPKNIQPHDIVMIRHELYEMNLMIQGISYSEAHEQSCKAGYDYPRMSEEYYEQLSEKQNKHKSSEQYNINAQEIEDDGLER
jgi:nucleoside-triphosphatase THEP1